MLIAVLAVLTTIALFSVVWAVWQLRRTLQKMFAVQQTQLKAPAVTRDISRQVDEIHQTMGGVVNSLKAMGTQVYNLNMLAGHALQEAQEAYENGDFQPNQIMLDIRRDAEAGSDRQQDDSQRQVISPEDLPPEMQERYRTFQAVYKAIIAKHGFPSSHRPELN